MAEMTPCPKNENHSSPQDCASCREAASQPWPRGRLFTLPEGVLAVNSIGCVHSPRAARSICVGTRGRTSPDPSSQTPVTSFIHLFIHVLVYSLLHSPSVCQALYKVLEIWR